MTNREKLTEIVNRFFIAEYNDHLSENVSLIISKTLDKMDIKHEQFSFALSKDGGTATTPSDNFDPNYVYRFWSTLQPVMANNKKNHLLQIFTKNILHPFLNEITDDNTRALSKAFQVNGTAKLEYTRFLNTSFLGKAEFDRARELNDLNFDVAVNYYKKCQSHLTEAMQLNNKNDRYAYGMLGVSHYYIARTVTCAERSYQLSRAIENLEFAESHGDSSTEHFVFLGNAFLELAEDNNSKPGFEKAIDKLALAYSREEMSPNIIYPLALANLLLGICITRTTQESGIDNLKESIRLFDLYESLESPKNYAEKALKGRRGQAYLQIWYDLKDIHSLDSAIENFKEACTENKSHLHNLANALFERYNLYRDREHIPDLLQAKQVNDEVNQVSAENISHFKQRGRIYLMCADEFSDSTGYTIAIESFLKCISSNDPEIPEYVGIAYLGRGTGFNSEEDLREAVKWLEASSGLCDRGKSKIGSLPKAYRQLAIIIEKKAPDEAIGLIDKSISKISELYNKNASASNSEALHYNGILGNNYFNRYKLSGLLEDIRCSRKYFLFCYDIGSRDQALLALLGDACLKIARLYDDTEDSIGFVEDAIEYLKLSKENGNEHFSNYSKLGQAYLSAYKQVGDLGSLKNSLTMFDESFKAGNHSSANHGLLGDCYYRLARYESASENLHKALEHKELAYQMCHDLISGNEDWKEHHSLVGRIHLQLFDNDRDSDEHFALGLNAICRAGWSDITWPWPVCQLAEVVDKYSKAIDRINSNEIIISTTYPEQLIWNLFLSKDSYGLWLEGAKLAARWPETKQKILGGKSKAYIEEDSHGLLSATFVFKPPSKNERIPLSIRIRRLMDEEERTLLFKKYLETVGDDRFQVPTPLGIIPLEKTSVYCMRRSVGRRLSDVILYDSPNYREKVVKNSIEFLAVYHAWHPAPQNMKKQCMADCQDYLKYQLKNIAYQTALPKSLVNDILDSIQPLFEVIGFLPLVEKKDVHTENWIITNPGRIVMIDLEQPSPPYQFLLADLVQLIEDLPLFSYCGDGWQKRWTFSKDYLDSYIKHLGSKSISLEIEPDLIKAGYMSLVVWRTLCNIGLAFSKLGNEDISSSGAMRWKERERHYFALVKSLPSIWAEQNFQFTSPDWRRLIALIKQIEDACLAINLQ